MKTNFFFQAEDVIRDYMVTGVQTCALPISLTSLNLNVATLHRLLERGELAVAKPEVLQKKLRAIDSQVSRLGQLVDDLRSEERRVGKECRRRRRAKSK